MDESRPLPTFKCEQIEGGRLAKEWQEWRGSLQCYFESYEITDQKLMRAKMLHLGGPQLQKVFRSLEGTEDFPPELDEKPWYNVAIAKLDAYFKPRRQDVLERHKLRNMKQATNERFAHYVLRLRQQIQDCGLEKYRSKIRRVIEEMLMIDVIVEGCASQELRRKILAKDQSLAEIEAMGESIESVLLQEKELGKRDELGHSLRSDVCKIDKDKGSRRHFEQRSRNWDQHDKGPRRHFEQHSRNWDQHAICSACGRRGHKTMSYDCPANGRSCRKCNVIGHFEMMCPKSKRSFKRENSEQPSKKIRAVEASEGPAEKIETKKVSYTFYGGNTTNVVDVNIGGVVTGMLVDSGSDANLITSKTWETLKSMQVELLSCKKGGNKILRSYASEDSLVILGTFEAIVTVGQRSIEAEFFVIENGQRDLIGDLTSKQLGILKVGLDVQSVQGCSTYVVPFSSIKGVKVRIQMDPEFKPVFQPLRRIPIALEDAVNKKLDDLLRRDIIEVKTGPATWVSPLVVANKANGEIRLCVDLRRVNQAVIRERHPMPVVEDVVAKIGRGKIWSVLDIKDAFFLLTLDEESRDIVTFITHRGLYRFTRLTFGLVSAPEVFQRHMDEMLADCEGAYWYLDDVGIVGDTIEEHDARLNKVLKRFEEKGVVLNWTKCKIRVTEFDFLGYRFSPDGIRPSVAKQEAVLSFRRPENESEVRSFLGLANYMGKFVYDLATVDEPLRKLTQKGIKFEWGDREEAAFVEIKTRIANARCLGFYRVEHATSVIADASQYALGAVLVQTDPHQQSRIICFASKSLTDTERRYCQTEREALSLVWSVERFQIYLIGREFNLVTDCKALTFLFQPTSRPCARIERWVLRLQAFQYKIIFVSGRENIADALSRLSESNPEPFDLSEELFIREVSSEAASMIAVKWEEIKTVSGVDLEIQEVVQALDSGRTDELSLPYRVVASELCQVDGVLLRGDRIVIPVKLRQRVVQLGHEGHPGARVMKEHLRSTVWWPKIDRQVEDYVKACRGCTLVSAPNPPEPMIRKELPVGPWQQIAIDFMGPLPDGEHLLVCVDFYSRYVEVVEMTDISTASTIKELLTVFSRYGVPESIRADNGPQLSSVEFKDFCLEYGVELVSTIPYWPQMNGEVERQNRSMGKRLQIAHDLGLDWRVELRKYVLTYHSTKHSTTGQSPAELMFNRKLRTKLPCVPTTSTEDGEMRDRDRIEKEKGRIYADRKRKATLSDITVGDTVVAKRMRRQNKVEAEFAPEEYKVVQKKGSDVIIKSSVDGKQYRRCSTHLKRVRRADSDEIPIDHGPDTESVVDNPEPEAEVGEMEESVSAEEGPPNAKRMRCEPARFKDYIPY